MEKKLSDKTSVFRSTNLPKMEAECYRGSFWHSVLSELDNLVAIGTKVFGLQQQLVEILVRICVWYHKQETRWKQRRF